MTTFHKGALVAQNPNNFENILELEDDDKYHLRREITSMCLPGELEEAQALMQPNNDRPMALTPASVLHNCCVFPRFCYPVSQVPCGPSHAP